MGYYVNPPQESKEAFLNREGISSPNLEWKDVPQGTLPVVLVDNGYFTAAAVAYSQKEYEYFIDSTKDKRPKKVYQIGHPKCTKESAISQVLNARRR